jgi:hypothetical protein
MAHASLSPKRAAERMRQHRHALLVIAHWRAKQAVKAEIRARGQKIAEFSARDIALLADALSLPKIISARSDDAVRKGLVW